MKYLHNIYATIICLLLVACSSNNDINTTQIVQKSPQNHIQQAYQNVMEIMADINPTKYTSLKNHTIHPIFYTSENLLNSYRKLDNSISPQYAPRSLCAIDTLLYILNFGEEQGFAIVSANKDLFGDMIFAIADSGSISLADFLQTTHSQDDGEDYEQDPTTTIAGIINNYMEDCIDIDDLTHLKKNPNTPYPEYLYKGYTYKYGEWNTNGKINPRIKIKIGQGYPYNKYCFTATGEQAVSGCVAIALVQLMSANKYPTRIGNMNVDWDKLCAEYKTNVTQQDILAKIIAEIGKECNMTYGVNASSSNINYAKECLAIYSRYSNLNIIDNPELPSIESMLTKLQPVHIRGNAKDGTGGHAWTIDGWLSQERNVQVYLDNTLEKTYTENRKLVHCVFGWNGTCDGYYNLNLFRVHTEGAKERESSESTYGEIANCKDLEANFRIITYTIQ